MLLFGTLMRPQITVTGLTAHSSIQSLEPGQVTLTAGDDLDNAEVLLNGKPVPIQQNNDHLVLNPPSLPEGEHLLAIHRPGALPFLPDQKTELPFTIDSTPPELEIEPIDPLDPHEPGEVRGHVQGADTVAVGDQVVPVAEDGTFTALIKPNLATITVSAGDAAGNTTSRSLPIRHPGMRAVHISASAWSNDALREPILELVRQGRIDTVQLDIKDESGVIGYSSQVPLAQQIGATRDLYDARSVLDQLHSEGVRVVGRLVAFRDPILGEASWNSGHHDRVIQSSDGTPWSGGYGEYSFTNFANPDVRDYNLALAEEAAELGFDDILYDYIRRPDGSLENMRFPGLTTSPEESVVSFLAESHAMVHRHGTFQGASVFGIAATRPKQIAQDIPTMSEHVDYISPMVYPSHWGPGEYGVAHPERQPYDITKRSLADFAEAVSQTGHTQVIPWLQAFSLAVDYGPEQVREQVRAAEDNGMNSFLLWNAGSRYDAEALDPT